MLFQSWLVYFLDVAIGMITGPKFWYTKSFQYTQGRTDLFTPTGLDSTSFSMYCTIQEVYRNEASVYICLYLRKVVKHCTSQNATPAFECRGMDHHGITYWVLLNRSWSSSSSPVTKNRKLRLSTRPWSAAFVILLQKGKFNCLSINCTNIFKIICCAEFRWNIFHLIAILR